MSVVRGSGDRSGGSGAYTLGRPRSVLNAPRAQIEVETVQVSIIGASRGTDLEASRQALAAGSDIPALVRSAREIGFSI